MHRHLSVLILFVAWLCAGIAIADDPLNIGDTPPPLALSSFVKGDKIDSFEPDKTYVVEFWATWCGPCRASIPHLTELAHQYKDVQFIGVDVYEHEVDKVQPFVDEMGDKMDYHVALDTVEDQSKPMEGAMAKTWMAAADEHGIPTAFVVHNGKIAWIGHPMNLGDPLPKILDGQWDLVAAAKQRLEDKEKQRAIVALRISVLKPYSQDNYKATLAVIDQVVKDHPELSTIFEAHKLCSLCNSGDTEAGLALGEQIYENNKDDAAILNYKFSDLIDPDRKREHVIDPRVAQLALKAAQRAVELSKEDVPDYLDSLAQAQLCTGDAKSAVTTEEKAVKLLREKYTDVPASYVKRFEDRLARFRKAADSGVQK